MAAQALDDGRAWTKFQRICEAQGGMRELPSAPNTHPVLAEQAGTVTAFDNRRLARAAKLAGAPGDAVAGIDLHVRLGDRVDRGQPLFTLHAEAPGLLEYALAYLSGPQPVIAVSDA